ncbi:tRNA adenosine(34) deaminase TadA [Leeia sp. TBRC 13508]|uniref:tRNA-specific adenosine deaminase n=1 Tax=Leeia speluncae TaxID=2884804 RepID=A0ABS8D7H8_9NEIS|nr:tRNA adenosine(34) deaminase TadA [Leeia speluncae]MCB6184160.1 tRNA adenosine(34) deaminase TadA [Leeia speluncae]
METSVAWSEQDNIFMREALKCAVQAYKLGEVPVGAVVVFQNEIIGRGYNQPIMRHDPSAHAEMMAIRQAARKIGNYRLVDCQLYVTLEPCLMCSGAIMHARIGQVIYGAPDFKTGACDSVLNVFENSQLNHHAKVRSGLLADEAVSLLKQFFAERRAQKQLAKGVE